MQSADGLNSIEKVMDAARSIFEGVNKQNSDIDITKIFDQDYNIIAENIGVVGELDNIVSFRIGNNTRYSYSAPDYTDTIIKMLKDDSRREEFLQSEYGQFEWFKKNGRWRCELLRLIETDEDVRNKLTVKELISIEGKEYTKWDGFDIRTGFFLEYLSQGINTKSNKQFAFYNMPIASDSPTVKFIRLPRYTGDFKKQIIPLLRNVVKQELYRINLVEHRAANKAATIQNFDKMGSKFCFFPELNDTDFLEEAKALIKNEDSKGLNNLIDVNVENIINNLFETFLSHIYEGTEHEWLETTLLKQGYINDKTQVDGLLEEYFWNQAFATTQIIELVATDLAFYKNDVDFQKRFKEVVASGIRLNTNTKYGKKTRKTVYISDAIITSNTFTDIKETLDNAVKSGKLKSFDRDNILYKFKDVNAVDGQCYVSPQAMRSILDMMGAWTPEMEESFERFEREEWDMSDFNTIWQIIKPFVYTQIPKPSGLNDGKKIKVSHQNKNSEFLLLAAYNMVANSLNKAPRLKALQKFMSENNIDAIQFESAVKVGGQGIININYVEEKIKKILTEEVLNAAQSSLGINNFAKASNYKNLR
jgi:hypothetical protein